MVTGNMDLFFAATDLPIVDVSPMDEIAARVPVLFTNSLLVNMIIIYDRQIRLLKLVCCSQ